jgi:ribonuclease R
MGDEGLIDAAPGRAFHKAGGVPKVTVLRVVDIDDGGNAWAAPERWESEAPAPKIRLHERGRKGALAVGDRVLARTEAKGNGYIAHPMKKLMKGSELVLGVVHQEGERHWLRPVDKRERRELPISELGDAQPGDLVLARRPAARRASPRASTPSSATLSPRAASA